MSTRVLVVEDEPLLAFDIAQRLTDAGYAVIGPAPSVARALDLLGCEGCDVAILDVNLGRETAEPIARDLKVRGIKFMTLSGYSSDQHPPEFHGSPTLTKPANPDDLLNLLIEVTGEKKKDKAVKVATARNDLAFSRKRAAGLAGNQSPLRFAPNG